ncbi:inositol monophosphatase family protein [Halorarum salinum]|uniref:fructose-bisphosphatase n=1 Tax=Halorarum salinum TaxID=2743089 RepID=A0A7D5LAY1_9EURY|nr:inositol monophosphatase [Halobaculum salinum]QLG62167.1 inositol monophosphatase [Halobaculum salinum]
MTSTGEDADRLNRCVAAAESGGDLALESFRSELAVDTKRGPMDAVTEVDRAVQRHVFDGLRAEYPDDPVVGEESDASKRVPDDGPAWVVDPIDGTTNYASGNANWVTSVAFCRDGEPVAGANYAPVTGDLYAAGPGRATRNGESASPSTTTDPEAFLVNPLFGTSPDHRRELHAAAGTVLSSFGDLRRFGCAQAALSGVACGELDAAVSTVELHDWDTAAGVCLIREAGGVVTDVHGDRWVPGATGLLASGGAAHDELVASFGPSSD